MTTETTDPKASLRATRKVEMSENLGRLGLNSHDYWSNSNRLKAVDPKTPDVSIELMHQDRGFSEAWMVGKPHSPIQRRRFPRNSSGGFNYAGIAKAIREMIEQRLRLRAQIEETQKMLAEQKAEDAANLKLAMAELAKLVRTGLNMAGDSQRVEATSDGLQLRIEHREPGARGEPRMKVLVEISEVGTADRMSSIISGLRSAGLWRGE